MRAPQFVHESPAAARRYEHFGATRVPVPVRILARLVDVERVMRVLQQRDRQSLRGEKRNQLLDQRCFAGAGVARKAEDFHGAPVYQQRVLLVQPDGTICHVKTRENRKPHDFRIVTRNDDRVVFDAQCGDEVEHLSARLPVQIGQIGRAHV